MEYLKLRPRDGEGVIEAHRRPADGHRVGDLVFELVHDMAQTRSPALGELAVRRRLDEFGLRSSDCDTLCGNLGEIAARGPVSVEDREILAFYFTLGLKGRLEGARGIRRHKLVTTLRAVLDFAAGMFGDRVLHQAHLLGAPERQVLWDVVSGTVLALGREYNVPGVEPAGALLRWVTLLALGPRSDRRLVAQALASSGLLPTGRLALVGLLDPVHDADVLARVLRPEPREALAPAERGNEAERADAGATLDDDPGADSDLDIEAALAALDGAPLQAPGPSVDVAASTALDGAPSAALSPAVDVVPSAPHGERPRAERADAFTREDTTAVDTDAPFVAPPDEVEVHGRVERVRGGVGRLFGRVTGWVLVERGARAFAAVCLGYRREARLRLGARGLVLEDTVWLLGRAVRTRTLAVPISAVAARLDQRAGLVPLLLGLGAFLVGTCGATIWLMDAWRTGYAPFVLGAVLVLSAGLAVDLALWRVAARLRGRADLVLDGGPGARIRLVGVRRDEVRALLEALAGPTRFGPG
jgi:hypothetical protein